MNKKNKEEITQAYSTFFETLSEMQDYVGKELGISEWIHITQERINSFAKATEDEQWIHTDPTKAAKESLYQTTIAHGFLILSLVTKFCYETYQIKGATLGITYGMEQIRFRNVVPVDSWVRGRVTLLEFEKKGKIANYTLKVIIELKEPLQVACEGIFELRCYCP